MYQAYGLVVLTDMYLVETLLFSHPMPVGIRVLVLCFLSCLKLLRIWGLYNIVETQGLWITEAHDISEWF